MSDIAEYFDGWHCIGCVNDEGPIGYSTNADTAVVSLGMVHEVNCPVGLLIKLVQERTCRATWALMQPVCLHIDESEPEVCQETCLLCRYEQCPLLGG